MSWWNTSSLSDFASQAIKNAQKKIDKVLDIEDVDKASASKSQPKEKSPSPKKDEFWNTWMPSPPTEKEAGAEEEGARSSWSMPWVSVHQDVETPAKTEREILPTTEEKKSKSQAEDKTLSSLQQASGGKKAGVSGKLDDKVAKHSADKTAKSSPDTKRETVGNIPVVKSKEKVENWDSSSAWTSESLVAWQGEGENISADFDLDGSGPKSSSWQGEGHNVRTNPDLERMTKEHVPSTTSTDISSREIEPVENNESKPEKVKNDQPVNTESLSVLVVDPDATQALIESVQSNNRLDPDVIENDPSDSSLDDKSGVTKVDKSSSISVIESTEGVISLSDESSKGSGRTDQSSSISLLEAESSEGIVCLSEENDSQAIVSVVEQETMLSDNTDQQQEVVNVLDQDDDVESEYPQVDLELQSSILSEETGSELVLCEDVTAVNEGTCESVLIINDNENKDVKADDKLNESQSERETVMAQSSVSSGSGDGVEEEVTKGHEVTEVDVLESLGSVHSPSACSSVCSSDASKLDSSIDTHTSEDTVVDNRADEETIGEVTLEEEKEEEFGAGEKTKQQDSLEKDTRAATSGKVSQEEDSGQESTGSQDENRKITDSMSSSSSYVKCMIEEAMEDNGRSEDNNSDCHSTGGEKSECSRSTGGHESGDDIDTTTSSDIEIISTPSSINNGDASKTVEFLPLKIALQKTARRESPTHRRTDSASSSSTQSRDGQGEQLSPGRDSLEDEAQYGEDRDISLDKQKLPPVHEENGDPYLNPQKVLKKMAEMAEIIQARESKLLQLIKENNDTVETNNILRHQLQQLEDSREIELEDVSKVASEFTNRIAESEKKLNTVIRERDTARKDFQKSQDEFAKRVRGYESGLEEKDLQISELLHEGEKLSKHQLQSNNIVKKLRAKEKENDERMTSQTKKIEEQKKELEHLRTVCDSKEAMEKKQTDGITQLNSAVQKQEREIAKLKGELTDAQERVRGLQAALDNSYKEIAELHKSKAAQDSRVHETTVSLEMTVREELKATLDKEQHYFKQEREALIIQIEDLRLSMSRMDKEHHRREDMLRQEISDLQMRLQEDEARNQDLTQSVTSATRPLLRQIENLQSTYAVQSSSWEKVEKTITDRLVDTQNQLIMAVEKERSASEKVMDLTSQVTGLESQTLRLRQEKSQNVAQLEMLKTRVEVLEDAKNSELAQVEVVNHQMSQELSDIKREKMFLETQLDMEKTKVEQEKKKMVIAQDQIAQLEREAQRSHSRGSKSASPQNLQRMDSTSSFTEHSSVFNTSFTQDDLEKNFQLSPGGSTIGSLTKLSLYEHLRQSGASNLLENLQSQLKLREGEIVQLQSDIQQLERTRESMARELVNLTNQNEELQNKVESLPGIVRDMEELNQRYNAMLQMYGEKVEEAQELRMDLHDVKEMYKSQIDHLLTK